MHPAAWLLWALCAGLVAMLTTNPFYLLPLVAAAWVVHAAHGRAAAGAAPFRIFLSFAAVAVALRSALVLLGPVDAATVASAALEGLRLGTMLVVFGAFNSVADPYAVLRLAPRRFHEPALAAALALQLAPRTVAAVARVREAQRLRGISVSSYRTLPAVAVPVLETGMEEALVLAESMDARGHGRGRRTRYRPLPWSAASSAVAASAAAALGAFAAAAAAARGALVPAAVPLAWPHADPLLLAAVALLALPAALPRRG